MTSCSTYRIKRAWAISASCFLLLLTACKQDLYNFDSPLYPPKIRNSSALIQYLVDPSERIDRLESQELRKIADYTKLPFQSTEIQFFNSNGRLNPNARVVCISDLGSLSSRAMDSILGFVARGGTLVSTKVPSDPRTMFLLGLKPDSHFSRDSLASGIRFSEALYPTRKGFSIPLRGYRHLGIKGDQFRSGVRILATAATDPSYPLVVGNSLGAGQVILLNSRLELEKSMRGLFFSMVLNGLEGIPYPIANVSTVFLDDFPSPVYSIKQSPIKEEYDITSDIYVQNVWWPDMKRLASERGIEYSAFAVFDYDHRITPPFTFTEWDRNMYADPGGKQKQRSLLLGQDVVASGHEMALHGYNHVSLVRSDWPKSQYMVTALEAAAKKWQLSGFGGLPVSYVPPSNIIDSTGLIQLRKAMPSIRYLQSTYFGDRQEGGDREFDPDPFVNTFFCYPRISSGFYLESSDWWEIESLHLFTGIWSHFVHPDDVFQVPFFSVPGTRGEYDFRNKYGLNWRTRNGRAGLFDRFSSHLDQFISIHPMTRFLNATKSSEIVHDWRYSDFVHRDTPGAYSVEGRRSSDIYREQFWHCYVSESHASGFEEELRGTVVGYDKREFLDGYLYTIHTEGKTLVIKNLKGNSLSREEVIRAQRRIAFLKKRYFLNPESAYTLTTYRLDQLIDEGNVSGAIRLFERSLTQPFRFSVKDWINYANWLSWDDRPERIWETIDAYYGRHPEETTVQTALQIGNEHGFPEEEIRELWLSRALNLSSMGIRVMEEYYRDFNTPMNFEKINEVLESLARESNNPKYRSAYISHLIEYKISDYLGVLKSLTPCDADYSFLASDIMWTLADAGQIISALKWSSCVPDLDAQTLDEWYLRVGDSETVAKRNFPFYLDYLISTDPTKALKALETIQPGREDLSSLIPTIAYLYADDKQYEKALEWVEYSDDLPMATRLTWMYELGRFEQMKDTYRHYAATHPSDFDTKLQMSRLLLYLGDVFGAAEALKDVPRAEIGPEIQTAFGAQIRYSSPLDQRLFITDYPYLLNARALKNVKNDLRWESGNDIAGKYTLFGDRITRILSERALSYSWYGKQGTVHRFTTTQAEVFPLQLLGFQIFDPEDLPSLFPGNEKRNLWGIEYGLEKKKVSGTTWRWRSRLEKDDRNRLFYQLGGSADILREKYFGSFQADWAPVKTGPGYTLELYQLQWQNGNEFTLTDRFRYLLTWESNYYSDGEIDILGINRMEYALWKGEDAFAGPLLETAIGWGTVDRRAGYPYWMDDYRLYAGGGAVLRYGGDRDKLQLSLQAAIYWENNEPNFESYIGNLRWRLMKYSELTAEWELFTLEGYNSNSLSLGFRYHLP